MKIIGLDVGTRRIGAAVADSSVRIAVPKTTVIVNNGLEYTEIARLARTNNTDWFVIGMPRNNSGEQTRQSDYVKEFAKNLKSTIPNAKIRFQDESLTSVEAEERLKSRKKSYRKEEIDAEAATIILQDFIENLSMISDDANDTNLAPVSQRRNGLKKDSGVKSEKSANSSMLKKLVIALVLIIAALGIGAGVAFSWYNSALGAFYDIDCGTITTDDSRCETVTFSVLEGEPLQVIGDNLEASDLVKNSLVFQIYMRSQGLADQVKTGDYELRRDMSVAEIGKQLVEGAKNPNVFSFTILPGETVKQIKKKLLETGNYTESDINAAFARSYRGVNPNIDQLLATLPTNFEPNAEPLEGYLFGDTYEFYKKDPVDKIIITALNAMWDVVEGNNLITKYSDRGLTLHQGITMASIIQKESAAVGQATVAQIFYSRLSQNMILGSDVTTQYAVDLIDPERKTYADNAAALEIDSPYNTRKFQGLPPGPICNPGVSALLAVANPADTSYLYFLTGDDGMMYYSYTEEEHNRNIVEHCKQLCNASL